MAATTAGPIPQYKPASGFSKYFRKNGWLLLLVLPGIVHILMIQYMPMFGMVIAFKDYRFADGIFGSKNVGFENFKFLFGSDVAWRITFNTILMNSLFIVSGTIVCLILALLLNEIYTSKMTQIYQFTLFVPFFVGSVIIGYIAYAILSPNGFINTALRAQGLIPKMFYTDPDPWRIILIIANLWGGIGFGTIIYLSGIIGINPEFYEAAQLDGANKLQQIFNITLPSNQLPDCDPDPVGSGQDLLRQLWPVLLCPAGVAQRGAAAGGGCH